MSAIAVPSLAAAAAALLSSLLPGTNPTFSLGTTYVCALPMMSLPATPTSFVCNTWYSSFGAAASGSDAGPDRLRRSSGAAGVSTPVCRLDIDEIPAVTSSSPSSVPSASSSSSSSSYSLSLSESSSSCPQRLVLSTAAS